MKHCWGAARLLVSRSSWLAVGLVILSGGCGAGSGGLAGKVTFQGQSIRMGSVLVVGQDGIPRSTGIQDDGSYSLENIPAGPVQVAVSSPDPLSVRQVPPKHGTPPPLPDRTKWVPIPARYAEFKQSGLVFTVRGGTNNFDLELK